MILSGLPLYVCNWSAVSRFCLSAVSRFFLESSAAVDRFSLESSAAVNRFSWKA